MPSSPGGIPDYEAISSRERALEQYAQDLHRREIQLMRDRLHPRPLSAAPTPIPEVRRKGPPSAAARIQRARAAAAAAAASDDDEDEDDDGSFLLTGGAASTARSRVEGRRSVASERSRAATPLAASNRSARSVDRKPKGGSFSRASREAAAPPPRREYEEDFDELGYPAGTKTWGGAARSGGTTFGRAERDVGPMPAYTDDARWKGTSETAKVTYARGNERPRSAGPGRPRETGRDQVLQEAHASLENLMAEYGVDPRTGAPDSPEVLRSSAKKKKRPKSARRAPPPASPEAETLAHEVERLFKGEPSMSAPGQEKSDSSSLQHECSARARFGNSTHASRVLREMIARPKVSRNERKTTEIGAFEVGNFAPFSCPGRGSRGTSASASTVSVFGSASN